MEIRKDIRKLTPQQLSELFEAQKQPAFRAKQVFDWLWKKQVTSFDEMTNLPESLRSYLKTYFQVKSLVLLEKQTALDGTVKCAFRLHDSNTVEGVLIPQGKRMTACVSSQVGCSLACKFCATGQMARIRNLEAAEIYDQAVFINQLAAERNGIGLSNIVFMGMGEPLLNYREVMESIRLITDPEGFNMSPQRITLSTAGISKMIEKLGNDRVKFNLALSLHAATDEKRSQLMPVNDQNNLASLKRAIKYFIEKTGTRVTFEYIVFDSFNDSIRDADYLIDFCRGIPVKINLIEYNPVGGVQLKRATGTRLKVFKQHLESKGRMIVNIRRSRGKDIDAACGQLANKLTSV